MKSIEEAEQNLQVKERQYNYKLEKLGELESAIGQFSKRNRNISDD